MRDSETSISQPCHGRHRCQQWRTCPRCAALRQAGIATTAEKIEATHGQLQIITIKPTENTQAALQKIKAALMRRHLFKAGIWTIETGLQFNGLHLNVISPVTDQIQLKQGEIWQEIITTSARIAAAYISKRSGFPTPQQYSGRLYGSFGRIGNIMISEHMPPLAQAAAAEQQLTGNQGKKPLQMYDDQKQWQIKPPEPTRDEYRQIAERHLKNVRRAIS